MELAYTRKPTIRLIATNNAPADKVAQIGYGIEEEGIPFRLQHHPAGEVVDSALQAARSSPLLVGIACDRHTLVVHYKNLPASAPLFTLMHHQDSQAHRNTGNNAARLVKGIPFRDLNR